MTITLRERTAEHVKIYFRMTRDADIRRTLPQTAQTLDEALNAYRMSLAPGAASFGRTIYADGVYVGDIWCYCIGGQECPDAMVSYCVFAKECWGRGIATCALRQFLLEITDRFRLRHIGAFTFADNSPSRRVLEANGFVCAESFSENGVASVYYQYDTTYHSAYCLKC